MNRSTHGTVIFCDDVRDEINEKTTIVGAYPPDIWVKPTTIRRLTCLLLVWTSDTSVPISAKFDLVNADAGSKLPKTIDRVIERPSDAVGEKYLITFRGRLRLHVGLEPLTVTATFKVGKKTFANSLVLDPTLERGR